MTPHPIAPAPDIDMDHLRTWIGSDREKTDIITVRMARMFNSIFDIDDPIGNGDEAPVGVHWCLAPDIATLGGSGVDGHPRRGGFLPPVPFPRRMWAGGELTFFGKFHVGDDVVIRSIIDDVVLKTGRTGSLVFVTVRHEYRTSLGLMLSERQDIVYREQEQGSSAPKPANPDQNSRTADISKVEETSPQLLFRYSAATFNSHRIHYDLAYATQEELYPGLVVHGPLQATHLLRLAVERFDGSLPRIFSFRSMRPLISGQPFTANAATEIDTEALWIAASDGNMTMMATAKK